MMMLTLPRALVAPCRFAALALLVSASSAVSWSQSVSETKHSIIDGTDLHVYVGTVALPADGLWTIRSSPDNPSIREMYLVPKESSRIRQLGKRMFAAMEQQHIERGRWMVQKGYEASRQFAQAKNRRGPTTFADFGYSNSSKYLVEGWNEEYWRMGELRKWISDDNAIAGPFVHLIPNVPFHFEPPENQAETDKPVRLVVASKNRLPLAFELRPTIDDGKHWVLYTDGRCQRVEIDRDLMKRERVAIRPLLKREQIDAASKQPNHTYGVVAISAGKLDEKITLGAFNQVVNAQKQIHWETAGKLVPHEEMKKHLSDARRFAWAPYSAVGGGGILDVWNRNEFGGNRNNGRRNLSMFAVLGGRAAIEETLQLQNLNMGQDPGERTVDLAGIQGVQVKSHPFDEMLGDNPGGRLEMANYVPADRFFVYVGQPQAIPALLDTGAPFIASLGTSLSGNCLQYNIEARYLARLGLTRDWLDAVLKADLTSEMAIFSPDLFFIDGTDVTVVARVRRPKLLGGLLSMLGAKRGSSMISELPTTTGSPAFLALAEDLLFVSTDRGELESAMKLRDNRVDGSLGKSSEFRYMLTQLPIGETTRFYAYMSDPFVRRLVGPEVKIGQRRRVLEKARMEALTARTLKAKLDGQTWENVGDLVATGFAPAEWQEGLSIDEHGLVRSNDYGTLAHMRTLNEVSIDRISPEEEEAYRIYVENYSRYWRRFFDPIAIRLDEVAAGELELSTFILPLVDNSIYNGLRDLMAHQDDGVDLAIPVVDPAPVLQFSANLKEQAWQRIARDFQDFFTRYAGASPAMLDDFGPNVHVAIFDADPIIAMGSGDIFGAFGGNVLRGGGNDMLMIPVVLSMLTRPCSIMVETQNPERTAQYLRQAANTGIARENTTMFGVSFYQVEDRDEWVWTMDVMGVVKLRYGIEVVDQYLVIRNIPWSSSDHVVSVVPAELNAAMLSANPAACKRQMPGLFAAACDGNRRAVMSGLARLYPFMLAGADSVQEAAEQHQRLYGFYPRQLPGDEWVWDDFRLVSRDYGQPTQQKQPAFDPNQPFGLMNRVESLRLNMQFEQDGLRSSIRWRLR